MKDLKEFERYMAHLSEGGALERGPGPHRPACGASRVFAGIAPA